MDGAVFLYIIWALLTVATVAFAWRAIMMGDDTTA